VLPRVRIDQYVGINEIAWWLPAQRQFNLRSQAGGIPDVIAIKKCQVLPACSTYTGIASRTRTTVFLADVDDPISMGCNRALEFLCVW